MAAISVQVPYPVFYDRDGQPLNNGNIYIGVANLDPVTNPVQVYYDEALTIAASQPLKTSNGYVYRNGTPAQLYVDAMNFSIAIKDNNNALVYSFPDGTSLIISATSVTYNEGDINAVNRTLDAWLQDYLSVKDFGAVGDGVTDDTTAIRNAIRALNTRNPLYYGFRMGTGALYFPEGVYRITQSGLLSDTNTVQRSGMTLRGAGKHNTILWLDSTGATAEKWFYNNGATQRMSQATFADITFAGGTTWQLANPSTGVGNGYANINQFTKGFKLSGPGWENAFNFNDCGFRFLHTVFQCSGSNNADTHMFIACETSKCINITVIDNPQSFNITWIGCYLSEVYGDTVAYTANASGGGGNFLMLGGAIITQIFTGQSAMSYVARLDVGGPSVANAPVTFRDVRMELRGNFHGFANASSSGQSIVSAVGCSFLNTGSVNKNFVTAGIFSTIKFDGCSIDNGGAGGRFLYSIGVVGRYGKAPTVMFIGACVLPTTIHSDVTFTNNGGRLLIDDTCTTNQFIDFTVDPRVVTIACDSNGGNYVQGTASRTRSQFAVAPYWTGSIAAGALGFSGTAIEIPPHCRIVDVWVKLEVGLGNANTVRYLVGSNDKSAVYGTSVTGPQNAGHYFEARIYVPVGTDLNKRRIRFWADNGAGVASTASAVADLAGGILYE